MKSVQDLLLCCVTGLVVGFVSGQLVVGVEGLNQLAEEVRGHVCHSIERSWLKVFEAGEVEDLAYGALKSCSGQGGSHYRTSL